MISWMLQLLINSTAAALILALLLRCISDASPRMRLALCWTALWLPLGCAFTIHLFQVSPFEVDGTPAVEGVSQMAATAWIAGVFLMARRGWIAWKNLVGVRARSVPLESSELTEGIVPVHVSNEVQSPAVIGFLHPVIVIPGSLSWTPAEWQSVLRHELAHVIRKDHLWNLAQNIVETVLFFSPGIWRISGMIRREREHAADDYVIQKTGDPLSLLEALVRIASAPGARLAMSFQPGHGELLHRARRLLRPTPLRNSRRGAWILALALLVSVQLLLPSLRGSSDSGVIRIRRVEQMLVTVR